MHRVNGSSELILVGELHFVSRCMTKASRGAYRARKDLEEKREGTGRYNHHRTCDCLKHSI